MNISFGVKLLLSDIARVVIPSSDNPLDFHLKNSVNSYTENLKILKNWLEY